MNYIETDQGTPQGGIISPTLCNIALNGIEGLIRKQYTRNINGKSQGIHLIRYADDMIITGRSKETLIEIKETIASFLGERGLELNEKKTVITHIKSGFDFLGFNIQRKQHNPRLNKESDQNTVLIIKPSKKGIIKLKNTLRTIIDKKKPIGKIIMDANPVLRG